MTAKQTKTRHLVETVYSLIDHYYKMETSGALSEQQAQEAAYSAVEKLRYESKDYFWINDTKPNMIMHPIKPALNGKDLSLIHI